MSPSPGDLKRLSLCSWSHESEKVILEVCENKTMVDTQVSTWRKLFHEWTEGGIVDWSIHNHDVEKPGGTGAGITLFQQMR